MKECPFCLDALDLSLSLLLTNGAGLRSPVTSLHQEESDALERSLPGVYFCCRMRLWKHARIVFGGTLIHFPFPILHMKRIRMLGIGQKGSHVCLKDRLCLWERWEECIILRAGGTAPLLKEGGAGGGGGGGNAPARLGKLKTYLMWAASGRERRKACNFMGPHFETKAKGLVFPGSWTLAHLCKPEIVLGRSELHWPSFAQKATKISARWNQ